MKNNERYTNSTVLSNQMAYCRVCLTDGQNLMSSPMVDVPTKLSQLREEYRENIRAKRWKQNDRSYGRGCRRWYDRINEDVKIPKKSTFQRAEIFAPRDQGKE